MFTCHVAMIKVYQAKSLVSEWWRWEGAAHYKWLIEAAPCLPVWRYEECLVCSHSLKLYLHHTVWLLKEKHLVLQLCTSRKLRDVSQPRIYNPQQTQTSPEKHTFLQMVSLCVSKFYSIFKDSFLKRIMLELNMEQCTTDISMSKYCRTNLKIKL